MSTHPGVQLFQKSQGGVWTLRWFAPPDRLQRKSSTLEANFGAATAIAEQVSQYMRTPGYWDDPPEGWRKRTYEIIGKFPHSMATEKTKQALQAPVYLEPKGIATKGYSVAIIRDGKILHQVKIEKEKLLLTTSEQLQEMMRLPALVESLRTRLDDYRRRATSAEAKLRQMEQRVDIAAEKLVGLTLKVARENWEKTLKGDDDYLQDQKWTVGMFVKKFKDDTLATGMSGREKEISSWIDGLRKEYKDENGDTQTKPIGASRRQEIRRVVLKFLRDTGIDVAPKAVSRPTKREVRRDRGPKRVLSATQAKAVADAITDHYWNDVWRLQVACGFRPNELPTLKRADFSNDFSIVTLSPLGTLTLKLGSRSFTVPSDLRPIIKRRLEEHDILFPCYGDRMGGKSGKAWDDAKFFDKAYRRILKAARVAAGIPFKLDNRVARRTCATLLLGAGVAPKAVADILGDNLATILEHYAAAIPGNNDPSKAVIV